MGAPSHPLSHQSQLLSQTQSFRTDANGAATVTFPSPPQGFTWTGTLNCATATTGAVFVASVGAVSWGEWGGNSVYGPVQVLGAGSQQMSVQVTGLAANTSYVLQWNGSSDPSELVAAVWPDSNSTALTAQISGTVPVSVAGTVNTTGNTSITGGSVGISGSVATTSGNTLTLSTNTTTTTATGSGTSTSLSANTTGFATSGFISVVANTGTLVFSYTGTTGIAFTGLTLLSGGSTWTIASGAQVKSVWTGTSTSLNVVSTATFPVQGYLSVASTSGSGLVFSYTGVTATSFTGLSLLSGASTATILNNAAVVTSGFSASPQAPAGDLLYSGSFTGTILTGTTNQLVVMPQQVLTSTYTGFILTFTQQTTGRNVAGYLQGYVPSSGILLNQRMNSIAPNSTLGILNTNQTYLPLTVDGGSGIALIFFVDTPAANYSLTVSWTVIGLRVNSLSAVQNSPYSTLDTVPYGGATDPSSTSLLTNTSGTILAASSLGSNQTYRIHSVSAIQQGAAATMLGYVGFQESGSLGYIATLDFNNTVAGVHAQSQQTNGTLLGHGFDLVGSNQTNKTMNLYVRYDVVTVPNIF